jgi:protocatechuate 3,4-dioxygenase beta subunit
MRALLLTVLIALAASASQTEPIVIQGTVTRAGTTDGIADAVVMIGIAAPSQFQEAFMKAALEDGATPAGAQAALNLLLSGPPELFQSGSDSAPPAIAPLLKQMQVIRDTNPISGPSTVTSDATGHFNFKDMRPGTYTLTVQRDGYFPVSGGNIGGILPNAVFVPVTVTAQQPAIEINVPMVRGASISGKVRDSAGQPAVGINVMALQLGYVDGRAVWNPRASNATDDRGDFRLFWLRPGEYALAANPPRPGAVPNLKDAWVRTFFPGAIDPQTAQRIVVKEGDELASMNIDLRVGSTVKVSGQMINSIPAANGQPAPVPTGMYLLPREPKQNMDAIPQFVTNTATDRTNGRFELSNIAPGSYDLIASVPNSAGKAFPTITPIEVGSGDLQNVVINMHPGTDVKARITTVGGTLATNSMPLTLLLSALESFPAPFENALSQTTSSRTATVNGSEQRTQVAATNPSVDATGTFTFSNVPTAHYTLRVAGLPDTAYVADIRKGDTSIFDSGFLAGGESATPIEVVVNLAGIAVEGTVRDAAQKPVTNATVVLAPPQSRRGNRALYKKVSTDSSGHFSMAGVAPGGYKVFAWEVAPPDTAYMNAEFMAPYEERGQVVTLTTGANANLQVLAIH